MRERFKFIPLLLLYVIVVMLASTNVFEGDEGRYVMFADNLIHGHYSPQGKIYLWNGPGYPIVLMPFIFLNLPLVTAKLLNALFLFMAILYFYSALRFYMEKRPALFFSYLLGIYYPFLRHIHQLLSEQLAIFLICGFLFHFCKLHYDNKNSWTQILIASFYLGYFAVTKVLFGYVILAGLLLYLSLYLWQKRNVFKKTFLVYLFAIICCLPYLLYTYSLTGRIFYWGNSGGIALYLMSTTYEDGYGDWNVLKKHRREIYKGFENLSNDDIDEEFKRRAIYNIIHYPTKYLKNWIANIGRLLFNYPLSYDTQKLRSYFYFIPNMFLLVIAVLCIYPTYVGRKIVPFEIYALLLFGLISFIGSSFVFVLNRQFWPLVPIFMFWMSFTLARIMKIQILQ
jgi:hypothetical protein